MLKARWQVVGYDDDDDDDDKIKQTYILLSHSVFFNTTIVWKLTFKNLYIQQNLSNSSWRVQLKNVARVQKKKFQSY